MKGNREECDLLGRKEIPVDSYSGIHTKRAQENFCISKKPVNLDLIHSYSIVKKACCQANWELGYIPKDKAEAIQRACDDIYKGDLDYEFRIDFLQGGAGTSTNMNINEVIANRALELMGKSKGDYAVIHPIETVNMHQSTNDTYPTALKISVIYRLRELSQSVASLQSAFQKKEKEFSKILKNGRTEMQTATPITLGAEFSSFSDAVGRDRWRVYKAEERIRTLNIGGTSVGTGTAAPKSYIFLVIEKLRELTGLGISRGENLIDHTANTDQFVEVSGIIKSHAANLIKISEDIRKLNFLQEIKVPAVQAGSSIMPGKVNPVLFEAAVQSGLRVIANDSLITECSCRGTFQINEFLPLIAESILESLTILNRIDSTLSDHIQEIEAGKETCTESFNNNEMLFTLFIPELGYDKAEGLLKKYQEANSISVRDFLEQELGLDKTNKVLSPENILSLGYRQ
ncbi:MAG: aspartate ammonia-lyase [Chitinivibrionales bacterium]